MRPLGARAHFKPSMGDIPLEKAVFGAAGQRQSRWKRRQSLVLVRLSLAEGVAGAWASMVPWLRDSNSLHSGRNCEIVVASFATGFDDAYSGCIGNRLARKV